MADVKKLQSNMSVNLMEKKISVCDDMDRKNILKALDALKNIVFVGKY